MKYTKSCVKISDSIKYLAFVILAGGQSTRFGTDKGLYVHNGKPLITHLVDLLDSFDYPIFITVNSKLQAQSYIEDINIKAITGIILDDYDYVENKKLRSPLIGMYSSLKELSKLNIEYTFFLSCDNPFITSQYIEYMIEQCSKVDLCIPIWKNQFIEPLLAIYRTATFYKRTLMNLRKKKYKLSKLLDSNLKINYVSIEDQIQKIDPKFQSFTNINDLTDLDIKK